MWHFFLPRRSTSVWVRVWQYYILPPPPPLRLAIPFLFFSFLITSNQRVDFPPSSSLLPPSALDRQNSRPQPQTQDTKILLLLLLLPPPAATNKSTHNKPLQHIVYFDYTLDSFFFFFLSSRQGWWWLYGLII